MKHRDIQLLKKIVSECKDITRYINNVTREEFLDNDIYQKATAMSLLNIGEHANSLTRDIWQYNEEIEWRKIVDLRNIVAHGYGELKMELVWNLAQNEVPVFMSQIIELLEKMIWSPPYPLIILLTPSHEYPRKPAISFIPIPAL